MPRAKANPDPAVEEYTDRRGHVFRLEAYRNGSYAVYFGEKMVASGPSRLHAGFGAPRWPSNRLQAEAMRAAQLHAEDLRDDKLR